MNVAKALAAFNRVTGDGEVTPARSFSKAHGAGWRQESQPSCRRWSGGWTTAHGETIRPSDEATVTTNQAPQRWRPDWRAAKEVDGDDPPKEAHGSGEVPRRRWQSCAPPWPTQQKVKDLARRLDRYYRHLEAMMKVDERLGEANDYTRKQIIQEAERVIEEFEMMGGHHSLKSGRLQKEWDECCPESWWPEDCDHPVYSEVARMITVLMGSFPTSKIPEPEIFVRVLMDDVMALDPSFVEMESTCRELRKTKKFMPSVSEVIEDAGGTERALGPPLGRGLVS